MIGIKYYQEYADLLLNKKQLQCFTAERIIKLLILKNNKIKNDKLNITGLNQVLLRKYKTKFKKKIFKNHISIKIFLT